MNNKPVRETRAQFFSVYVFLARVHNGGDEYYTRKD